MQINLTFIRNIRLHKVEGRFLSKLLSCVNKGYHWLVCLKFFQVKLDKETNETKAWYFCLWQGISNSFLNIIKTFARWLFVFWNFVVKFDDTLHNGPDFQQSISHYFTFNTPCSTKKEWILVWTCKNFKIFTSDWGVMQQMKCTC